MACWKVKILQDIKILRPQQRKLQFSPATKCHERKKDTINLVGREKLKWVASSQMLQRSFRPLFKIQTRACPAGTSVPSLRLKCRTFATSRSSRSGELRKTPLYDLHVNHGGKMVPFGGYSMPVQYGDLSVRDSHLWTRGKASLFDVGHMVQHHLRGPGAQGLLEKLTPASLGPLGSHQSTLSCFLHQGTGGIVDDSIITKIAPSLFYFVTNAACREKDCKYLNDAIGEWRNEGKEQVDWQVLEGQGLIALQGPLASKLLEPLIVDYDEDKLDQLYFGTSKYIKLRTYTGRETAPILASRGGYTGEDGFEISIAPRDTADVVEYLLTAAGPDKLRLAGLGARDSLRLEAGMCLYGHDLDDTTTPVEGGLSWVIAKDRRTTGGFNGAENILEQLKPRKNGGRGVERRRVGLLSEGPPAREGAEIVGAEGESLGKITSGCPSPSLQKNIAMGYLKDGHHKSGTSVFVVVRGKKHKATVTKMPFVPSKYWKGGASPG